MILQLNPMLPVFVPHMNQSGYAFALIDYSQEHDVLWGIDGKKGKMIKFEDCKLRMKN